MKKILLLLVCFLATAVFTNSKDLSSNGLFSYIDPLPGAELINKQTSITFRTSEPLNDESLFRLNAINISGSIHQNYDFTITKLSSSNTYIIKPELNFINGEKVTVSFSSRIKYSSGTKIEPCEISFNIKSAEIPVNPLQGLVNEFPENVVSGMLKNNSQSDDPPLFPQITVTYNDNAATGILLLSNIVFDVQIPNTPYLLIIKNDGTPVFSRQMSGQIFNFDRQPNGNFTYFNRVGGKYYELDSSYTLIDSFYTGNGYFTDLHELRVLPNHHALLMSYDKEHVDMSLVIAGGNPNALVTGLIIQEIDENKNVIFQWRSWDHIQITDATHENLLTMDIDYVHGNALELDNDGNILLSSRHLDEITKINRSNASTIWRLGGKNNQFNFTNDPQKFSYQHGIRRLPNGHIIMFDNGNYHPSQISRSVEYILDENNMTATKFWEYSNNPSIFGSAMGFSQRLDNGNTLVSWGATNPTLTEVRPDGSKALEISFSTGVLTYRAFKYDLTNGVTGIQPVNNEIPLSYNLMQNYPNPFNPSTKIKFQLPKQGVAKIEVFDELGRLVKSLLNEDMQAGNYEIDFSSDNIPSGIYFYRLSTTEFSQTRKMILIK
ncbi:MAG: aryl-sulfate sulfotransferase [Ignavibacteria bacterium]